MKIAATLIAFFAISLSFGNNSILVKKDVHSYGGEKISHLAGEPNNWNASAALDNIDDFKSLNGIIMGYPFSEEIDWLYFTIENKDGIDIIFNTGSSLITAIKVFKLTEDNVVIDSISYDLTVENEFRAPMIFEQWIPLLKENEPRGKFLIGMSATNGNHEIKPVFGNRLSLTEESQRGLIYTMIYAGIMLMMIMYNSILAWVLKDKLYLIYVLNLISIFLAVTFSVHQPMLSYIMNGHMVVAYPAFFYGLPVALMALFTSRLFKLKETLPKWNKILWGFTAILVVNGVSVLLLPPHITTTIFVVLIIPFYIICALIGFVSMRNGNSVAKPFFISWLFFIVGVILYFMVVQLGLFYNELCHYANYITSSIEAMFFAIALSRRYTKMVDKERETAIELQRKNKVLKQANESLDSFNYHVNHDLKTLLVNVGSLNKMIKKYTVKEDGDRVIVISDKMTKVIEKGHETVSGFLTLGQAINVSDERRQIINVKERIHEIADVNGFNEIQIDFELTDFKTLNIGLTAFDSIFLNLISNSIKYCEVKPKVKIALVRMNGKAQIIYSDNGIGVDLKTNKNDLFNLFKRLDNDLKEEGSGIGLFLVKRMITEYGGTIIPESEVGNGLKYTISFPEIIIGE